MTLRHIEIFSVVCQEGSITRAAERLHISQPTVSVAIREMEEYYGAACLTGFPISSISRPLANASMIMRFGF